MGMVSPVIRTQTLSVMAIKVKLKSVISLMAPKPKVPSYMTLPPGWKSRHLTMIVKVMKKLILNQ